MEIILGRKGLVVATIAKIHAVTRAIIEPLPVFISAERYKPINTDVNPKNWVHSKQDLKLLPTNCAVAAGVTNRAVTRSVPTT